MTRSLPVPQHNPIVLEGSETGTAAGTATVQQPETQVVKETVAQPELVTTEGSEHPNDMAGALNGKSSTETETKDMEASVALSATSVPPSVNSAIDEVDAPLRDGKNSSELGDAGKKESEGSTAMPTLSPEETPNANSGETAQTESSETKTTASAESDGDQNKRGRRKKHKTEERTSSRRRSRRCSAQIVVPENGTSSVASSVVSRSLKRSLSAAESMDAHIEELKRRKVPKVEKIVKGGFQKEMLWPICGRIPFPPDGSLPPREMKRLGRNGGKVLAPHVAYQTTHEVGQLSFFHIWRKQTEDCFEYEKLILQLRVLESFLDRPVSCHAHTDSSSHGFTNTCILCRQFNPVRMLSDVGNRKFIRRSKSHKGIRRMGLWNTSWSTRKRTKGAGCPRKPWKCPVSF